MLRKFRSDFRFPVKSPKPRFVTRTVIDGKVRIRNRFFTPDADHIKYDDRLEGIPLVFGLYWERDNNFNWDITPFVYLWGTKAESDAMHKCLSEDDDSWSDPNAPYIVNVNGAALLPWCFWGEYE